MALIGWILFAVAGFLYLRERGERKWAQTRIALIHSQPFLQVRVTDDPGSGYVASVETLERRYDHQGEEPYEAVGKLLWYLPGVFKTNIVIAYDLGKYTELLNARQDKKK